MSAEGIAIVGMSGRFPGARDVDTFWKNIKSGVESITHFTLADLDIPVPSADSVETDSQFVCAKGILDDVDQFDARFFGFLPREAELMDPQHRIFLEICWEAIEHAGYDASRYPGAIGVFGGCYMDTYLIWNLCSHPEFLARLVDSIQVGSLQTELGNDKDYLATRVAFKLGLRGPAMTIQTACSTSLVSIATACQSLDAFQCDMALAGGVTLVLPQRKGYFYKEGGMLSPDGYCRTFDEKAAGTVFSNGAGVLLLKRVADAITDGDTIYAVIRGYATNNDGGAKVSYTAPSVDGQAEVISLALAMGDIDARTIGYVEAHGTATPLGDPIEVAGLTAAYRAFTTDTGYCAIGSVKTNLGHLDVSSGAIGLIKTALSIHEGVLPPSIHFTRPNPKIDFARSPFYVNTVLKSWPASGWPRRAGVSSFGVGGTNAHVIVEQAPEPAVEGSRRSHSLLVFSAKSEAALDAQAAHLAAFLTDHPGGSLEDVAYTLQVGRREFEHRRFVVASSLEDAVARLGAAPLPGHAGRLQISRPKVVFMFPGQGAQYPGMAKELYASEPVFREVIERCCAAMPDKADRTELLDLLISDFGATESDLVNAAETLEQTRLAQPAIFAVELALARLLQAWGIEPCTVLGHSIGEFAAACVAGVFGTEEAMRLVATRGRLMQAQPAGRMLAVRASVNDLEDLLPAEVRVAAVNAPGLTVLSGYTDAIAALSASLAAKGVQFTALKTSHAFHSPMMEPARKPLVDAVDAIARGEPTVEFVSTSLARSLTAAEVRDPAYWGDQILNPVRFADAVSTAAQEAGCALLEVGPGQTLSTLARQCFARQAGPVVVSCLGPVQAPGSAAESMLSAVGRLWIAGFTPAWGSLQAGARRRVALPTYPFERKRFWVEPAPMNHAGKRMGADSLSPREAAPAGKVEDPELTQFSHAEQLVRQQLALIAEQLSMMAGGADGNDSQ